MRIESNRPTFDDPWSNEPETIARARASSRTKSDGEPVLAFHATEHSAARSAVDAASPLTAAEVRDANAGARLDALRDAYSGPYTVNGEKVSAGPMFRMNGGFNDGRVKAHGAELATICARAHIRPEDYGAVSVGRGTPEQLVRVTQALIDAGKLPPPPGDVASRIKQMQWGWGIGVDCAGYTYRAAMAASGASADALGLKVPVNENFRGLDGNGRFKKIDPTLARPGDVITLDPRPPETVGHNVIVRSHEMKGTVHTFEVDSAWGAGESGDVRGGFRRETWSYDESTRLWSWTDRRTSPPQTVTSPDGPSGDAFHGCYRPKAGK